MSTTTDPKNQTVSYGYDDTLRTFTLTDARGKATVFHADVRGLRTSKIYPGRTHEDSTYDAVGNLAAFTSTAGNTLSITYDPRNRATLRDWSDATLDVSATYDAPWRETLFPHALRAENGIGAGAGSTRWPGAGAGWHGSGFVADVENRGPFWLPDSLRQMIVNSSQFKIKTNSH